MGRADNDQRSAFAEALITARRARRLTQQQLAELLGVTQPNVSSWEGERWTPDPQMCAALEVALEVPAGHLCRHLGYIPAGAAPLPPDVPAAIAADPLLSDADREVLLVLYRQLAGRTPPSRRKK
jgi:transcriptional regulator with XRE-family HTH domain